jgi:hypothetical protein
MTSDRSRKSAALRTTLALVFFLALTAGFYWRLTISGQYTWLEGSDIAFQVRPWLDFQAREFHARRLPLWAPYEWGGQSLIGQVQPGFTNPLNWILFALPLRDGHIPLSVLHWYWVLIHWLGAVFCYALCRDLKAGQAASLLGASVFALTGFVGHTDWPQMLMSAIWMPLVLLFFARLFRGERPRSSAAFCGAALGMAFLSGHHQVPIDATVLLGALWLWFLVPRWRQPDAWFCAAIFAAVCLLAGAFQTLPALEYGRHAVRWAGAPEPLRWNDKVPFSVHAQYSFDWSVIPGLVLSRMRFYLNPFVGITAAALALSAVCLRARDRDVRLFTAVALGGLILALGSHTPVYWLAYRWVPLVEKARTPAMAIVFTQLAIAALAAMAIDAWSRRTLRFRYVGWLALALALAECVNAAAHLGRLDRPGSNWKMMREQEDIGEFLRRQPGWFRVQASEEDIPYNFGDFFGIEQFGSYVASMPENVFHVLGRADTPRLFGIRYRIAHGPANPPEVEVFRSRSGLKVFRNPDIEDPLWSEHDPPCPAPDRLRLQSRDPGAMTVRADMACAGLVVTGDLYAKGWRVLVDGRKAGMREFAGVVRAVPVEAGHHRIEYTYRPPMVYWGAALSVVGLAIAGLTWQLDRRRRV